MFQKTPIFRFRIYLLEFLKTNEKICVGSRIGDQAIDLNALPKLNYFEGINIESNVFARKSLNHF